MSHFLTRSAASIGAAFALTGAVLGAQPQPKFPTSDAVLQRIWRLGMDSSQVVPLSQALFDSIGPRLTGSPGILNASNWVLGKYKEWGIEGKREPYGTWRGWRRGISHIDLLTPRVRSLEGLMLAWSPGTKGVPVRATTIILPKFNDSTEFKKWLPQARGKIVLMSPSWPTCRPSEDWLRWGTPASIAGMDSAIALMQRDWTASPDSGKLYRGTGYSMGLGTGTLGMRLEKAGVVGMITSRPKQSGFGNPFPPAGGGGGGRGAGGGGGRGGNNAPGPMSARGGGAGAGAAQGGGGRGGPGGAGGWGTVEVFETYNKIAPAVTLTCEDYSLVYRLTENKQKPMIRLDLDATLLGEQPAFNTIGMIKGSEKPDEYVMLSAHFDSWDASSGATDNGTGTMMAMEAMRILKKVYPNPKRTIMVGHWASEEQGLNGSKAFTEDHPEILKGLQALFNQDNGTGRVQSLTASGLSDIGAHLKDWYNKLPSYFTDSASSNVVSWSFNDSPGPATPSGTDGSVFGCFGTPSFGMGAVSWNYNSYTWHTNRDTYDKVVFADLKHNATLAAMMVYLASEDPNFIKRDRSPGTWPANWPKNCLDAPRKTRPRY